MRAHTNDKKLMTLCTWVSGVLCAKMWKISLKKKVRFQGFRGSTNTISIKIEEKGKVSNLSPFVITQESLVLEKGRLFLVWSFHRKNISRLYFSRFGAECWAVEQSDQNVANISLLHSVNEFHLLFSVAEKNEEKIYEGSHIRFFYLVLLNTSTWRNTKDRAFSFFFKSPGFLLANRMLLIQCLHVIIGICRRKSQFLKETFFLVLLFCRVFFFPSFLISLLSYLCSIVGSSLFPERRVKCAFCRFYAYSHIKYNTSVPWL